ncbi:MAG: AtpZ/AtpI family protein [Pseudomonadota bacterium]
MSEEDLSSRRKALQKRLDGHEAAEAKSAATASSAAGYAAAFRLSTEFVSAILVGAALGFGLDFVAGTAPWFLIVFLLLGFVAGILNVLRSAGLISSPQVGKTPPGTGTPPGPNP